MLKRDLWDRRGLLMAVGAGVVGTLAAARPAPGAPTDEPHQVKGNIKQSICRWCYGKIPLKMLATEAQKMGYKSIELLLPQEYLEIKPLGLTCAMIGGADIANGLNRPENHERILKQLRERIEFAAAEKLPSVICMAGNRRGLADDEGLKTCALGLKKILGLAVQMKVNVMMEGLNS